jgi:hypothetical protein
MHLFNAASQSHHLLRSLQNINAHFEDHAIGHTERLTLLLCQPLILHCGALFLLWFTVLSSSPTDDGSASPDWKAMKNHQTSPGQAKDDSQGQ